MRYRELYGTTLADPRSVVRVGFRPRVLRGISNLSLELATRSPSASARLCRWLHLKNGVPINYIEAIGFCEWMEVGFNTFYTFPRRRSGMDLCPGSALPLRSNGNDCYLRLSLPARPRQ